MNEKEIQESFIAATVMATIKFGKTSLITKIEIFKSTILILEESLNLKKELQEDLLLFLEMVREKGPIGGSKMIFAETKENKYWREVFSHFFPNGPLNEKMIKIFLSTNGEMIKAGSVFLEEAKMELKQLEALNKECNN